MNMDNNRSNGNRPKSPGGYKNSFLDESSGGPHNYGHARSDNPQYRHSRPAQGRGLLPMGLVVAIDVLIAVVLLGAFSLYYFIIPRDYSQGEIDLPTVTPAETSASPSASSTKTNASVSPSQSATQTADASAWRTKFKDKFTTGKVEKTDHSYKSANISVDVKKVQKDGVTYYVADIYIAELKYFKTALASGKYSDGNGDHAYKIAAKVGAIVAINGDNSPRNKGPVVRNGKLYPEKASRDVGVLYNDGTFKTYSPEDFDIEKLKTVGAWQAWTFGPMLLKDGQPMETFNSKENPLNPRTAIGYYEPGHYCFVVVDGRQTDSKGMTTKDLSKLFYSLKCKAAFNLDGGQSAEMAFMGKLYNTPFGGGRAINDIVYIADK
jgi:exopolysaccharide biosynthesis protein